ncbi:MAG: hypothetical protein GF404_13810, partial [candidate division Zixibacteria bacterium]|nr:hypothetical protein [candidate division Zixibacteria bacterium]
ASEEQSAAAEQISKNVEHISSVTKETAAGAEQSASAAEQLNRQAEGLRSMVGRFRVRGGNLGIIDLAKTDHMHYIKNLEDILEGRKQASHWKSVDHHNCRFGKWYYAEGKDEYGQNSAYKQVENPHAKVHQLANDAMKAYQSGNKEQAGRLLEDAAKASHEVVDDLDTLKESIMAHA